MVCASRTVLIVFEWHAEGRCSLLDARKRQHRDRMPRFAFESSSHTSDQSAYLRWNHWELYWRNDKTASTSKGLLIGICMSRPISCTGTRHLKSKRPPNHRCFQENFVQTSKTLELRGTYWKETYPAQLKRVKTDLPVVRGPLPTPDDHRRYQRKGKVRATLCCSAIESMLETPSNNYTNKSPSLTSVTLSDSSCWFPGNSEDETTISLLLEFVAFVGNTQ